MLLKPGFKAFYSILGLGKCTERNCRGSSQRRRHRSNFAHELMAIHLRHADIADDKMGPMHPNLFKPFPRCGSGKYAGIIITEQLLGNFPRIRLVINDKNFLE